MSSGSSQPPKRRGRPPGSSLPSKRRGRPPGSSQPPKRRGRPPGEQPSPYMLKKAAQSSSLEVVVAARERSTSSPEYVIYACQWDNCHAKLHNLPTLRKHISKVHKPSDDEITNEEHLCRWENCQATFNLTSECLDHIESNHLYPIGMWLGDGPSSTQIGKPQLLEVSFFLLDYCSVMRPPNPLQYILEQTII